MSQFFNSTAPINPGEPPVKTKIKSVEDSVVIIAEQLDLTNATLFETIKRIEAMERKEWRWYLCFAGMIIALLILSWMVNHGS